ncbi:hypothetical protein C1645_829443 [Glomus cerebriforme]|uniref:Uncharacterized protein n=1 Tax=Glomus cerebriforme TaxID=658196 RepID=A0A397SJG2_9GLOM|nr:hypothetical protein C1645_829443 [Glomus cerebriforme]
MSNIIKRYPNINVLRSCQTLGHEEEIVSERLMVAELKWKIDNLEGSLRQVEEKNTLLREYNGIFEVEMDKLYEENKALQERSPDEANNIAARTFIEQSDKIYKKLIPKLKKLMNSEDETRQKLPDNNIYSAFVLSLFLIVEVPTLGCVRPAAEEIQHAYDAEKIKNETTDVEILEYGINDNNDKMTQYDDASLTDLNLNYLLNLAEINLIQPKDLDEISENSQSDIILDALYRTNIVDK